jgi:hypothetical protein
MRVRSPAAIRNDSHVSSKEPRRSDNLQEKSGFSVGCLKVASLAIPKNRQMLWYTLNLRNMHTAVSPKCVSLLAESLEHTAVTSQASPLFVIRLSVKLRCT